MANFLSLQLKFDGPTPVVVGRKHLTVLQLIKVLKGLDAGALPRLTTQPFIQVQSSMVQASATATCAAVQSGDTVSIAGQALTAAQRRATGTVTAASAQAADTVTINGVVFTAVSGAVTLGQATFDCSGTDTACAASLAAQVAAYASPLLSGIVGARSAAAVCTFYALTEGTAGNSITLATSNNSRLAKSGTVLANGAAATNNTFDFAGTNNTTAASLAAAITNSTTAAVKKVTASAASAVVTVTSKAAGLGGNTNTFTSSNGSRLAVTGAGFLAGGSEGAVTKWFF